VADPHRRPMRMVVAMVAAVIGGATFAYSYWREDILRHDLDPGQPFQTYHPPAAPDYASASSWYLRPAAGAAPGRASTFFVHSTTFYGGRDWLGAIDNRNAARRVEQDVLPNYAGPFWSFGPVWAPKYRQASLYAYRLTLREDAREARLFAYADVARAYRAFLATAPKGRPLILAGVGQGAQIVERLARESAADPSLRLRIAAVYLMEEVTPAKAFGPGAALQLCRTRREAGCVVAWRTLQTGRADRRKILARAVVWGRGDQLELWQDDTAACVNPVSGASDGALMPHERHLGGANASGRRMGDEPKALPNQVETQCDHGFLLASTPEAAALRPGSGGIAQLQPPPFNLFYDDIKADVRARLSAWSGGDLASPIPRRADARPAPVKRIS
jgi:hypothetical protein